MFNALYFSPPDDKTLRRICSDTEVEGLSFNTSHEKKQKQPNLTWQWGMLPQVSELFKSRFFIFCASILTILYLSDLFGKIRSSFSLLGSHKDAKVYVALCQNIIRATLSPLKCLI